MPKSHRLPPHLVIAQPKLLHSFTTIPLFFILSFSFSIRNLNISFFPKAGSSAIGDHRRLTSAYFFECKLQPGILLVGSRSFISNALLSFSYLFYTMTCQKHVICMKQKIKAIFCLLSNILYHFLGELVLIKWLNCRLQSTLIRLILRQELTRFIMWFCMRSVIPQSFIYFDWDIPPYCLEPLGCYQVGYP